MNLNKLIKRIKKRFPKEEIILQVIFNPDTKIYTIQLDYTNYFGFFLGEGWTLKAATEDFLKQNSPDFGRPDK